MRRSIYVARPLLPCTTWFIQSGAEDAIAAMQADPPTEGVEIWKIYNHGWIVRGAEGCWGFDVHPGRASFALTTEQMDALVDHLDVLSISHWHRDHASEEIMRRAVQKGIPVLVPPTPEGEGSEHLREDVEWLLEAAGGAERIVVPDRESPDGTPGEAAGIPYTVFPGHQDECLANNVILITLGGRERHADGRSVARRGLRVDRPRGRPASGGRVPPRTCGRPRWTAS